MTTILHVRLAVSIVLFLASVHLHHAATPGTVLAFGENSLGQSTVPAPAAALLSITPSAPWIEFQPVDQFVPQTMYFELIAVARGSSPLSYQWHCDGTNVPGATNANLVFPEIQLVHDATYSLTVSNAFGQISSRDVRLTVVPTPPPATLAAWGDNSAGQLYGNGMTNIVAVAGGDVHTMAIRGDGTVVAWGGNAQGQSNVPAGLSNVVAIAAGFQFSVALKRDGTVTAWGANGSGQANVPQGLSNVVAISAGNGCTAALKGNGSVVVWGACSPTQLDVPPAISQVVAISMGNGYCLALKSDGTLLAWGWTLPDGLTNIVAMSSGPAHSRGSTHGLVLTRDDTVVSWGGPPVPAALNNIASIAAGGMHGLARRSNGTVVAWGDNQYGQTDVPDGLAFVSSIAASAYSSFALTRQVVITTQPTDQYVPVGTNVTFSVFASGTPAPQYQWRFNGVAIPAATNSIFVLTNTQPEHAGYYNVDVSNTSGALPSRSVRLWLIPKIVAQPQSQVLTFGQPLVLALSVTGMPPFTFTWFRNNSWIGETTEPVFARQEVQFGDAGAYSVMVHNEAGSFYSVFSDSVYVGVVPRLDFTRSSDNVTLIWPPWATWVTLQFTTNLALPITWTDLPTSANSITVPLTSPQRFYRLIPIQ